MPPPPNRDMNKAAVSSKTRLQIKLHDQAKTARKTSFGECKEGDDTDFTFLEPCKEDHDPFEIEIGSSCTVSFV